MVLYLGDLEKSYIMGNENAKVIVSQGKGIKLDGTKNPHSWSIMDSEVCLNWILEIIDK
jgi:hypothetical protein